MTVNDSQWGCWSMAVEVWRVGWHRFEGEDLSVCSKRVGLITQHTQSPSYIKEAPPSCTPDWEDMDLGSLGRCDGLVLSASVFLLLPCDLWELIRYDLIRAESQLSETDCAVLSRFLYCFRPEATFSSTWTSSWMNSGTRTALLYSVCCRKWDSQAVQGGLSSSATLSGGPWRDVARGMSCWEAVYKGCRPCRRPRKKWQRIKANGHKYSSVLRTFRSSPFILRIFLWNIFDRFEWNIVYQIVCSIS